MATYSIGSTGSEVKKLQQALIKEGYGDYLGSSKDDGIYGKGTEAAVKAYQKNHSLVADGIAGKNTLSYLYDLPGALQTIAQGGVNSSAIAAGGKPTLPTKSNTPAAKPSTTPTTPAAKPPATQPPAAKQPEAKKPEAKKPEAKQPEAKPPVAQPPSAPVQPFTYEDFTYDDFNYDKKFSYDDFSYGNFSYADYAQSDAVKQAHALLQQHMNGKPGDYQSIWLDEANSYLNQYQNRDPFSYNPNADALYNQYKDLYIQQGKMAMMDTMGQAATMTGGYGNSYAQSVGQQAYNQQLNQLNEVVPELYGMALNRYTQEGQDLLNMYGIYMDKENQEYAKYQDNLNNWYTQLDYLTGQYDSERNFDYNKWSADRDLAYNQYTNDRSYAYDQWSSNRDLAYNEFTADRSLAYDKWSSDRNLAYDAWSSDRSLAYDEYTNAQNMAYQQERDAIADAQWQAKFDADDARWQAEFDEEKRRYDQSRADSLAAAAARSTGGGGNDEVKYTTIKPGSTEEKAIKNEIKNVTDLDKLQGLYDYYVNVLHYEPEQIKQYQREKLAELQYAPDVIDTYVDNVPLPNDKQLKGGPGGVWLMERW